MNNKDLHLELRATLEAELADILSLSATTGESRAPVSLDQQSVGRLSRMDAMQGQAMAQAAESRRKQRVGLIQAALQRMDEGEYGFCLECGDEISDGRLNAEPTSTRCVACAAS
ncbi:MAG: TraR/DksA family transcriptional regulator [Rhizobiales bacterium]|nr:TraR/DksA family transcriptional regulator [Hyphomicrobiales bacterium]